MTSISISDMQNFAESAISTDPLVDLQMGSDVGNVISLGGADFSDDIRLNLIANNRISSSGTSGQSGNTMNVTALNNGLSNDISVAPLEPLEPISLDIPMSDTIPLGPLPEIRISRDTDFGSGGGAGAAAPGPGNTSVGDLGGFSSSPFQAIRTQADIDKERKEKAELLTKLNRMETRGYTLTHRFTMENSLEEIKGEFDRLSDQRNLEASIKFQRQMMMGFITGAEMMNNRFDPFGWQLDGWSESVHENVEDFDEVFEELYDKYKGRGAMPPEARLVFMLAGSGFMFHMSNQFFRDKTKGMDMGDILKQNPELAKQFAAAAANAAGPGFGNFMGMSMGLPPQQQQQPSMQVPGTGAFYQSVNSPAPSTQPPQMPPAQMPQAAAAAPPPSQPRREMRGPSGVDDILRTFEEARRAEAEGPIQGAVGFGGPAPVSSIGQPAVQVLNEVTSIASEEVMSQADSTRTGRGGGGGRRKKTIPAPQVNTISMNV